MTADEAQLKVDAVKAGVRNLNALLAELQEAGLVVQVKKVMETIREPLNSVCVQVRVFHPVVASDARADMDSTQLQLFDTLARR